MPHPQAALYLHEEIMLLALRDEKGTVEFGSMYAYALGGAILAELLLAGRISVEESKRKLVNLVNEDPIGEPVVDDCLQGIAEAKRRAAAQTWVRRFGSLKNLHHRVARGLCGRDILRVAEKNVLLVFRRTIYPEINPQPERKLIACLRNAIFGDSICVDPRTTILISLASSANLLRIPFDKKELKKRKKRIEQLVNGELMGKATKQAVEAAQAAAVVACIMPAMIVTTTSS
jgi:hypothetical protein